MLHVGPGRLGAAHEGLAEFVKVDLRGGVVGGVRAATVGQRVGRRDVLRVQVGREERLLAKADGEKLLAAVGQRHEREHRVAEAGLPDEPAVLAESEPAPERD